MVGTIITYMSYCGRMEFRKNNIYKITDNTFVDTCWVTFLDLNY